MNIKKYYLHQRIIYHFTDTDLYKFTMCYAILICYPHAEVVYEFKDRNNTVYPKGFAELCNEQVKYLENLILTQEEEEYMRSKLYFLPSWFFTYLRGFRYRADRVVFRQDEEGHLILTYQGNWAEYVLYEVQLLAIVSELTHRISGHLEKIDLDEYYKLTYEKTKRMFDAECHVAEFGTRRRLSFDIQETAIKAMIAANNGREYFTGTSNVYLAMKYKLNMIGTHAHEWVASIAGFEGSPLEANFHAMEAWQKAYDGSLGIYLYDTYGFNAFANNFTRKYARMYDGLRVDSGINLEQRDKIVHLYKKLGVDPTTKTIMFSNALDADTAIDIQEKSKGICKVGFGIGGFITSDGKPWGIPSCNIVIKVIASRISPNVPFKDTCKMSEDEGKFSGSKKCYEVFKWILDSVYE